MFDPNQFDELAKKLLSALPSGIKEAEQDVQEKFKEILKYTFAKMDLVTREEFDVQVKVLARTREKLEKLQAEIDLLISNKSDNKSG